MRVVSNNEDDLIRNRIEEMIFVLSHCSFDHPYLDKTVDKFQESLWWYESFLSELSDEDRDEVVSDHEKNHKE